MHLKLNSEGPMLDYQLIRSKRKTISLQVYPDKRIVIRAPLKAKLNWIEAFVREKQAWIHKQFQRQLEITKIPAKKNFVTGEEFLFLGNQYLLEIQHEQKVPLKFEQRFYLALSALPEAEAVFIDWYKKMAKTVISERVQFHAEKYGFQFKRIRIGDAKTRWGSCSADNHLNFSWRLIMAPLSTLDYVVVHELAHTIHKNHSKRFWQKVASVFPNFANERKWLKENGHRLVT